MYSFLLSLGSLLLFYFVLPGNFLQARAMEHTHETLAYETSKEETFLSKYEIQALMKVLPKTKESVVFLGTSAQPPTLAHAGLLHGLRYILNSSKMVIGPTLPYGKPGTEKGNVPLKLAKALVENFDAVLEYYEPKCGIYSEFHVSVGKSNEINSDNVDSVSHFRDKEGKNISIIASHLEFDKEIQEYASQNEKESGVLTQGKSYFMYPKFRKYYVDHDDPNQFYIVSGADSFLSLPAWTTPPEWSLERDPVSKFAKMPWLDFFRQGNWVVVSRSGSGINMSQDNPLKGVMISKNDPNTQLNWNDWLEENFDYHQLSPRLHVYKPKISESRLQNIIVVDLKVPQISSTKVRELYRNDPDDPKIKEMVVPSVLELMKKEHYYQ